MVHDMKKDILGFRAYAQRRSQQFGETAQDLQRPPLVRLRHYVRQPALWVEAGAGLIFTFAAGAITEEFALLTLEGAVVFVLFVVGFLAFQYLGIRASAKHN